MATRYEPRDSGTTKDLLKALGNETRLRIMRLLLSRNEPLSPLEAANELRKPLSNISHHFRYLTEVGAICLERKVPVRGAHQHFYLAVPEVVDLPWVASVLRVPGEAL